MGFYEDEKIDDIFAKLKPILGEKKINMLWALYNSDSEQKGFIGSLARYLSLKYLNESYEKSGILLPPIPKELAEGQYPLGYVTYKNSEKYLFSLRAKEWTNHIAIFGRSGSGKPAFQALRGILSAQHGSCACHPQCAGNRLHL